MAKKLEFYEDAAERFEAFMGKVLAYDPKKKPTAKAPKPEPQERPRSSGEE